MGRAFEFRRARKEKRWGKMSKTFTKIGRQIAMAVKAGGPDPATNSRLRTAIQNAKGANMPKDTVESSIKKAMAKEEGSFQEATYEGYGPGGVAVYVEVLTDNKMRTTPEIRHLFSKHGGNLGEPNSVSWMFDKKGHFVVSTEAASEERLMEIALDAGADDLQREDEAFEIYASPEAFPAVQRALEAAGIPALEAAIAMKPQNVVRLDGKKAQQCLKLLEVLEEQDDVQHVYANLEVDEADVEAEAS